MDPHIQSIIEKHNRSRAEAWIDFERPLWIERGKWFGVRRGPMVMPLTWRRFHLLAAEKNPVIIGESVTRKAIVRALWILSPAWRPSRWAWTLHRIKCARLDVHKALTGIRDMLDVAFCERPPTIKDVGRIENSETKDVAQADYIGMVVDWMASEYGWSKGQILDMQISASYVTLNALMLRRRDPNGSEPVVTAVKAAIMSERAKLKRAKKEGKK